jgi:hypothetical protein
MFGPLKEALGGKLFQVDEEVQEAVREWLLIQPEDSFFMRNPGISEALGDLCLAQQELC